MSHISNILVGKLDLPHILEDSPDEFFTKIPPEVNDPGGDSGQLDGQREDGEFGADRRT